MLENPLGIRKLLIDELREEVAATGFEKVLIGLSGGADSALVADIAVAAVGKENVKCIFMPSEHTSVESATLAQAYAEGLLGVEYVIHPIGAVHAALRNTIFQNEDYSHTALDGVPDENIQARARGMILMGIANVEHRLVLATGNLSEALMGYCTMYGDTVGFREVIGELFKTECYQILEARYKTLSSEVLRKIIDRAPSAELNPTQKDTDNLPPYEELDPILVELIKLVDHQVSIPTQTWNVDETLIGIVAERSGAPRDTVQSVLFSVRMNAWKMGQCPPPLPIGR